MMEWVSYYGGTGHKFCGLHRGCGWQTSFVEPTKLMPCTSVEFLRAEEKRGALCHLIEACGLSNQPPLDLCQQHPTYAYLIRSRKWQIC